MFTFLFVSFSDLWQCLRAISYIVPMLFCLYVPLMSFCYTVQFSSPELLLYWHAISFPFTYGSKHITLESLDDVYELQESTDCLLELEGT